MLFCKFEESEKKKYKIWAHERKIFFFFLDEKFIRNYDPFFSLEKVSIYVNDDVEMHSSLKGYWLYSTHHF